MTQVTLTNKDLFDATIADINARLNALGAPVDSSGAATLQQVTDAVDASLVTAAGDATTKSNAAVSTASTDATTKANAAQSAAQTDATNQISAHNASGSAHSGLLSNYALKTYVDGIASGISSYPQACDYATTANVSRSGLSAVDGSTSLMSGQRILVWKQTNPVENGVFVASSGSWTRATDFDSDSEITKGALIFISSDPTTTTYGGFSFVLDTPEPQIPDTTALSFRPYSRPDQISVSSPLQRIGNTISVISASITDSLIAAGNKDGAYGTPSLRTLGTTNGQALPGDHPSVNNARIPTAHAASHGSSGSDAINPAILGITGANVAFTPITGVTATNVQNAIAQVQTNIASQTNNGSFAVSGVSGNATVNPGEIKLIDASAGPATVTLAAAANNQRSCVVKKSDSTSNPVLVVTQSGTIDGGSTVTLNVQYQSRTFASDTTNYSVIGSYDPIALFARVDQDTDFGGHAVSNFRGLQVPVTGSTYTPSLTDAGKTVLFTNTGNASLITVTLPNNFPLEWSADFCLLGSVTAQLQFTNASGASLQNAHGQTKSFGRYATVTPVVRTNTTGTNALWELDGDTA